MSAIDTELEDRLLTVDEAATVLQLGRWEIVRLLGHLLIWRRGMTVWASDLWTYIESIEAPADGHAPATVRIGGYRRWSTDERAYAEVLRGDPCSYCGAPTEAIDHIGARARGGEHAWGNFTAACKSCNSTKSARPLLTFLLGRVGA